MSDTLQLLERIVKLRCPYVQHGDVGEYRFLFSDTVTVRFAAMTRHTRFVAGATIAAWARNEAQIQWVSQMCDKYRARDMEVIAVQIEAWGCH